MEENKEMNNQELNQNTNQEATNGGQPAQAPQKNNEVEEVAVIEVPVWVGKLIGGVKKVGKFVLPVAVAAVGAFAGVKIGSNKERTRSKAETDSLNRTIDDLRAQLDSKPLEIPMSDAVTDVPFSEVVDTISE